MKTNDVNKLILLHDSGELTPRQQKALEKHLHEHPGIQTSLTQMEILQQSWKASVASDRGPSDAVLQNIHQYASQHQPSSQRRRGRLLLLQHALPRLTAIAAAVMMMISAAVLILRQSPTVMGIDTVAVPMDVSDKRLDAALGDIDASMLDLIYNFVEYENPATVTLDALAMQYLITEEDS
ncbi:MAG TPA: hypothetical protein DCS43_15665 [Verrucomicrobia bacterium]|nr:hypothetical protein [Verrucomicrobiota bacterium]